MVDPTTVNTSLAVPIRGTDVGTWDLSVNSNFTSIDSMMGGVTSIALTSASVTLATSQALVSIIRVTGTLLANVSITLPGIYKGWTIDNQILNSPSSFAVTLVSTSGANIIGLPPGPQDIFYDGTTINYRNLGRIGEYWDYASLNVPSWVLQSTKPPYLNCNGTTFSSATYPILTAILGSTTLPDSRGRFRAVYNAGTGRITSAGGLNADTIYLGGGLNTNTLVTANLPAYTPPGQVATTIIQNADIQPAGGSVGSGPSSPGALPAGGGGVIVTATSIFSGVAKGGTSN